MNDTSRTTRTRRPRRRRRRAFTLVEMIVVVTIIALLATLVAPRVIGQLTGARERAAKAGANAIATAVELYIVDSPTPLTDDFELEFLVLPASEGGGPGGPYLHNADKLNDPWGNPFTIIVPGEVNYDFDIVSNGPDGQFGTDDDITH